MIGIIGGYGDIGRKVVESLYLMGHIELLVGSRNKKIFFQNYQSISYNYVDLYEEKNIKDFVEKCSMIINCTGLTEDITEKLLYEVQKHKCDYIEPQYNSCIKKVVTRENNIFVQGVGTMPGLSGVLPIFLKSTFDRLKGIKLYYLGNGTFTKRSARDFLDGMSSSDNLAMVRFENGRLIPNSIEENKIIPIFNRCCMMLPYFDKESREVCNFLKLEYAEFYMAIENDLIYRILMKARERYKNNPEQTIEDVCNASKIDYNKNNICGFVIEAEGVVGKTIKQFTLVLKAKDASTLTGEVIAVVADFLMRENKKSSNNILSMWEYQVWNEALAKRINESQHIYMKLYDCSMEELSKVEEGEI